MCGSLMLRTESKIPTCCNGLSQCAIQLHTHGVSSSAIYLCIKPRPVMPCNT